MKRLNPLDVENFLAIRSAESFYIFIFDVL